MRKDLQIGKQYGDNFFVDGMKKYRGKLITIRGEIYDKAYFIEEEKYNIFPFIWTEKMFVPVNNTVKKLNSS